MVTDRPWGRTRRCSNSERALLWGEPENAATGMQIVKCCLHTGNQKQKDAVTGAGARQGEEEDSRKENDRKNGDRGVLSWWPRLLGRRSEGARGLNVRDEPVSP